MPSTAEPARRRKLGVDWVDDLAILLRNSLKSEYYVDIC